MDPHASPPPDERAGIDEERPVKRQCRLSPSESTTIPVLDREMLDTVMPSVDGNIEENARTDQQNIQIHATAKDPPNAVEDQLVMIPGLGNIVDHAESSTSIRVEETSFISNSNMPDLEKPKSDIDSMQSQIESTTLPEQQNISASTTIKNERTDVNEGDGDGATMEELTSAQSHNVNDTGAASSFGVSPPSQDTEENLLTQPPQDQRHVTDQEQPISISELVKQEENGELMNNAFMRKKTSPALPSNMPPSPAVRRISIEGTDVDLQLPETVPVAVKDEEPDAKSQTGVTLTNGNVSFAVPPSEPNVLIPSEETDGASMVNLNPHLDAIEASIMGRDAEWETDSSPIESSSSSDSSSISSSEDSSGEDDDDGGADYALLGPEEQARILMQGDGGSDDEGGGKRGGKGGIAPLRTLNERPEEVIPKPDIMVTPEMNIEELGKVECTVEDVIMIKAETSGEYQVLETGSLLCLEDRTVVGVIAETLGRVQQPFYTIRFANMAAIEDAGLSEKGTTVYYVKEHSKFVFTYPLRSVKGTDASNFHDEEVGEDEMEFSDDEKEAEHKRQVKLQKQAKKGLRLDAKAPVRGSKRSNVSRDGVLRDVPFADVREINYDDVDTTNDGYTPLQRPRNYQEMVNGAPETFEDVSPDRSSHQSRDYPAQRGRGRGGRADRRGRGRGGREPYRKGSFPHKQRSGSSDMGPPPSHGYQRSTRGPENLLQWQHSPAQSQFPQSYSFPLNASQLPQAPTLTPQSQAVPFSPSPISPLPSQLFNFPDANYFQQTQQQQTPQMPPPGSYVNPAFFNMARSEQSPPGIPPGPYGNAAENTDSYRQVNELLASLNAANRQAGSNR